MAMAFHVFNKYVYVEKFILSVHLTDGRTVKDESKDHISILQWHQQFETMNIKFKPEEVEQIIIYKERSFNTHLFNNIKKNIEKLESSR